MFGFYINDEEQLKRDFIKDNFCPYDKDPLTHETDDNLSIEKDEDYKLISKKGGSMFEKIQGDLKQRMAHYNDSRQPTGDEVTIAWLISEIERLREKIDNLESSHQ